MSNDLSRRHFLGIAVVATAACNQYQKKRGVQK